MTRRGEQGVWKPTGFGEILRRIRDERGLSQQALADAAGCHVITISKLERGRQEPAWPLVLLLAKALGVGVEAFAPADY